MGVESGSSGSYEVPRPRSVEAKIEGEFVQSFPEITFDEGHHIPLSDIHWATAALRFKRVGSYTKPERWGLPSPVDLYTATLQYQDEQGNETVDNLSLLASPKKPVLFTGTKNGFYAHDPLILGKTDPFYLVGIQPYELEERMSELSAIWHELGHVGIFHANADTDLAQAAISLEEEDLPAVANAIAYGNHLAAVLPERIRRQQPNVDRHLLFQLMGGNHQVNESVRLFHERNAWAGGIQLARGRGYPTGFQNPESYFAYAKLCLLSYANHFNDRKFVTGWKTGK